MDHRPTPSSKALELLSEALGDYSAGRSQSAVETKLREALVMDPNFGIAREALAVMLVIQGNSDQAVSEAKRAVNLNPTSATAHYILGTAFLYQHLKTLARDEVLEAQRLDPDNPRILLKLGVLDSMSIVHSNEASSVFHKAVQLAPYIPKAHALLASDYLAQGKPEEARHELRLAEHYDFGGDGEILYTLAVEYSSVHDLPKAVEYYGKFIDGCSKIGLQSPDVDVARAALAELKPRLTPNFVSAAKPRKYSADEFQTILKAKLTPSEYPLVSNPFTGSPEMEARAENLVLGATNEMDKARRLFEELARHVNNVGSRSERGAEQAFANWLDPKAQLNCQDYTFLFVAMARSIGLEAYYVLVNKDYRGNFVSHACAGVVLGDNKALLIDPGYQWFGVPHKDYWFQDDLVSLAALLAGSTDLVKREIAVKLAPNWEFPRFNLAMELAQRSDLQHAREQLEAGLKLGRTNWFALLAQGVVEFEEKNTAAGLAHIEQGLSQGVDFPTGLYIRAYFLDQDGKLKEARDAYRAYLQGDTDPEFADYAREQIARLNELLSGDHSRDSGQIAPVKDFAH